MSYLALGAVTKAVAELLSKKMNKPALLGTVIPKVTALPPDDERVGENDGVNLFLYRVSVNPFFSNTGWRGDRQNPSGTKRPPLALTLHYLLTAYAKKADGAALDDITSHQLLGNAMAILHEYPVLNDVHDGDFDASLDAQFAPELRDSFEKIKVSIVPAATTEEFSKIWTGFSKALRLSVLYEVSLVQIAPAPPYPLVGPPVQSVQLSVATRGVPLLETVSPPEGAAGTQITIKGSGLKAQGRQTVVTFGDVRLAESDLVRCTPGEIVLAVPSSLQRGPRVQLTVDCGAGESAPAFFEVRPWINFIQPLRGIGGIPLAIPFQAAEGTALAVEFDGQTIPVTYDDAAQAIMTSVPESVASSGLKPVVLLVGSDPVQRSNARLFELMPQIETVNITTQDSPAQTTIVVTGKRLAGNDVHLRYGELLIRKGENADAAQLQVSVPRLLQSGLPVSVLVDNRESNPLPPQLQSVEPAAASRGAVVRLNGRGLSGKAVVVKFGATSLDLGPQAFATLLEAAVPVALEPGDVQLQVNIDGADTNALTFTVLG
ncbi:MAG TPA: Pvc16 family protein [Pyrinomonadaceae bacterium]|nr:Pvc16 family protein [Pyrinomonadaceae bacterium]